MSRDVYACMIDLDELKAVQGSGDRKLLDAILRDRHDVIADHDAHFGAGLLLESYTSLGVALEQVIDGTIDPSLAPRFQFEHSVALIADVMGEPLDSVAFREVRAAFWDEINRVIRARSRASGLPDSIWPTPDELLERGPLLPVPLDADMPLGTGYLTASEIATAAAAVKGLDLENPGGLDDFTWPEEALEAAQEYRGWILEAAARQLGIFLHA